MTVEVDVVECSCCCLALYKYSCEQNDHGPVKLASFILKLGSSCGCNDWKRTFSSKP